MVPPVVLGAVPPIGGVFGREWDAARDRLLLVTEAGHRIAARSSKTSSSLAISLTSESGGKTCSIELDSLSKSIEVSAPEGSVVIKAKSVKIVAGANESVSIDAPGGSLAFKAKSVTISSG